MQKQKVSERILSRADKFIQVIASVHGYNLASEEESMLARSLLESEAYYLESALEKSAGTKNDISDTTDASQDGLFLEVIGRGLSFNPSARLLALIYRNTNVTITREDKSKYTHTEKRLAYYPSYEGKTLLCIRSGAISRIRPVQIVRENDLFTHKQINGADMVEYQDNSQGTGRIIAGFMWIVLPDGSQDFFKFFRSDMDRLHGYAKSNGFDNDLYSSNNGDYDPSFFVSKIISHGLNRYDKNRKPSAFEVAESEVTAPAAVPATAPIPAVENFQPSSKLW